MPHHPTEIISRETMEALLRENGFSLYRKKEERKKDGEQGEGKQDEKTPEDSLLSALAAIEKPPCAGSGASVVTIENLLLNSNRFLCLAIYKHSKLRSSRRYRHKSVFVLSRQC